MRVHQPRTPGLLVGATVALLVFSGCENAGSSTTGTDTQVTALPTTTSQPPSAFATPVPEAIAVAQAERLVQAWNAENDALSEKASRVSRRTLRRFLSRHELQQQIGYWRQYLEGGYSTNGVPLKVFRLRAIRVSLPSDGEVTGPATIRLRGCYDVTGTVTYDRDGNDISTGVKIDVGRLAYTVVNNRYPDEKGWRISAWDIPGKRCAT